MIFLELISFCFHMLQQKSDKKLPEVFSIYLTTKLRRMATQGKIERVSSSTHESIPSFLIVLG